MRDLPPASVNCWSAVTVPTPTARCCGNCPNAPLSLGAPELDLQTLLQAYVDRWEIECNHRDEKSLIGVAQGQVWNPQAVARLPQFQVAIYSLLMLASILAYDRCPRCRSPPARSEAATPGCPAAPDSPSVWRPTNPVRSPHRPPSLCPSPRQRISMRSA